MKQKNTFAVTLMLGLIFLACEEKAPDKIVFGQAVSLSGSWAQTNLLTTEPVYRMWIEELNKDGGLYIQKYGKKIPVELLQYDDESDIDKMKTQLTKLILEDKVDFLLPPISTAFLHEAATIANKYGYILMGGAGGAIKLKEVIAGLPYFFNVLNFADTQMPVMADLLEEVGVESVAILMVDDLHGVEYAATLVPELAIRNIDVVMVKSYQESDPNVGDVIAEAITEADALEADAFIGFTYPVGTFTGLGVAMAMNYNPKLLHFNVGPNFANFPEAMGGDAMVEGIMVPGAWTGESAEGLPAFEEKFNKRWGDGDEPTPIDYWGTAAYYAGCQFFQQAIEKAGSLDQAEIRDIMATNTFDTVMGPIKFEKGMMVGYVGQMGQWQDGVYEVIGPEDQRTADPIYPKPPWPEGEGDDTDSDTDTDTNDAEPDAGN